MALWPFRRKSRRKRPEDRRGRQSDPLPLPRSQTAPDVTHETQMAREQPRRQTAEANKLHRRDSNYSFSPGRDDSNRAVRKKSNKGRQHTKPPRRSTTDAYQPGPLAYDKEIGEKDIDRDMFSRAPTLHNKRDGQHLMPRKKSSKRRKADHDREAEIKAMSNFVPFRPATEEWLAGRPMKRDTRRVRTGLGLSWDKENRSSDISLPTANSIHSTMSSDSEHISFRVSALEALAPRPTLRLSSYPRWSSPASDAPGAIPARLSSQRRKFWERGPLTESTLKAHKRVDDIADELNASDLRELMERDKRRRERKRQTDQEKLERRLARRAEKQRDENVTDVEGDGAYKNLERGVLGRDAVGLGADPASAVVTSNRTRPSDSALEPANGQHEEPSDFENTELRPQILDSFHRTSSVPPDTDAPPSEPKETAPHLSHSPKAKGLIRSTKSRSKSSFTLDEKPDDSERLRKGSETSSSRGPMSWMSIFRWTNRARRDSEGPSSFSNTSRETMQTTQLPTPSANYISQQKLSGVPKRTMSRFREDLPETTPISPPLSRVQSPDADVIPPTIEETSPGQEETAGEAQLSPKSDGHIYGAPPSPRLSFEMRQTPSTFSRPDEPEASPAAQNMSLASIDSEASWLSGRIGSRRHSSATRNHPPRRLSSSNNSPGADHDTAGEDVSIIEDEYLSRLTPSDHETSAWNRKSGEARPSSEAGDEARWGSVRGGHPAVVRSHAAERMKSREGLLNSFGEEAESDDGEVTGEDNSPTEGHATEMQRATSINLGKGHVRNFSAGSAKLLDLTPRTSVDGKRRSVEPR